MLPLSRQFLTGQVSVKRLKINLRSESSARFEKGINHADVETALNYAAAMTELMAGPSISGVSLNDFTKYITVSITLDQKINHALGLTLNPADVVAILINSGLQQPLVRSRSNSPTTPLGYRTSRPCRRSSSDLWL